MVVKFGRLTIKGTDLEELEKIKDKLDKDIDKSEMNLNVGLGEINIFEDIDETGEFTLNWDFYLYEEFHVTKYKDLFEADWEPKPKQSFLSASFIKYNNCSHDEEFPQPCEPVIIMEWSA